MVCVGGKVGTEEYNGEDGRVSNTRGQKKVESQNDDNVDADAGRADVQDNVEADADSDMDADVEEDNVEKDGIHVDADVYEGVGAAGDDDYDSSDGH